MISRDEIQSNVGMISVLMSELCEWKREHPEDRLRYQANPGSILNAYREGDLSFDEAVAEIGKLSQKPESGGQRLEDAAEIDNLRELLDSVKEEIATDCNLGKLVELLFYSPLREAETELRRLRGELAAANAMVDTLGHPMKSPFCEHSTQYSYSEDGGKNIRCLLCTEARLRAELADTPVTSRFGFEARPSDRGCTSPFSKGGGETNTGGSAS